MFFVCGIAVFLFGSNYYRILPTNQNPAYEGGLAVTFLIAVLLMKGSTRWGKYWQIAYAFFIASTVWFITTLVGGFGNWTLRLTNGSASTWFRGIFSGKLQPLIGPVAAILLTALLFPTTDSGTR